MPFPTHEFAPSEIKYRFGERYASEASNRKFLGVPLGVYLGFTATYDSRVLSLAPDARYGYSLARVISQDDPLYNVDVIVENEIILDFSEHNTYPVNVVLKATGRLGFPHSAEIVTQMAAPVYPTEILIAVVNSTTVVDVSEPFSRDTPYAYTATPLGYGFMKDGAVEELLAAIAVNLEVANARVDLSGFTHGSLDARLEEDGSASAMAERLGKETRTLLADDFVVASPTGALNISRAFSRFHRNIAANTPVQDFEGFASETRVGAITSGTVPDPAPAGALTDSERNVCAVIDASTEERLADSSRQVAYGRLVFDEIALTGTEITFNNLSTTVDGVATAFISEVEVGDIIQDPVSGDYFEVATITSNVALDLSVAFPNATTPGATPPGLRRRFTLNARTRSGPTTDALFTIPASTIRVYFNAWVSVESSQFDYFTKLHVGFEEPVEPSATTALQGKALLTPNISDGKAGSIFAVQRIGLQVGPPHIHTVNFNGAALAGPGVADVTQRGPIGLPGPPGMGGVPGPTGPQGPQGQGFTNFSTSNLFDQSPVFDHSALGSGAIYSHTTTMSGAAILFLTGGNSSWFSTVFFDSDDHWQIDNIEVITGTTVRLSARVPTGGSPAAKVRFFLNAATRT